MHSVNILGVCENRISPINAENVKRCVSEPVHLFQLHCVYFVICPWLRSYTQPLYCPCFVLSFHACLVHPCHASRLTSLLCFHHMFLGQSSLFFFALLTFAFFSNPSFVLTFHVTLSCSRTSLARKDKMRASFLLLLCVVLLATATFANEAVSTCRIPTHCVCQN